MKDLSLQRRIMLLVGAVLCVMAGLLIFIFFTLHRESVLEASIGAYYRTEMYSAAEHLIGDIENGELTLAYHHSKYASDHASRGGMREAAVMFDEISRQILAGEMSLALADRVRDFVENGILPEGITAGENSGSGKTEVQAELPPAVGAERYKAAKESAMRLFGGENIPLRGERTQNGELLFSCRNAYVLIDERTALPIEGAISLEAGEMIMSTEECVNAAQGFLYSFFPEETVKNSVVQSISPDLKRGAYNIIYSLRGKRLSLSVRWDNGRVTRFICK